MFRLQWKTYVKFFQGIGIFIDPKADSHYPMWIALGNEAPVFGRRIGDEVLRDE